ncbi:HAMP domain-containing histidine kinase [Pontibacter sp. HSC-14F20]|uniref:HAMP domain-containing sensor histidine kinase n=1 Tax=Pontibacter sp. HSC-14F20 TaxID=2864136 RepID=UPI001C737ED7|nr:HAMP domain-containing sensor histidine kinase [Pontibacter sp. HSC-14F20]MBX0335410.1 HAMP domain-containing histidine kinase [Pontibacter sp. HSC-14F20]
MNLKQKLALRSTLVCAITLLLVFGSIFYLYWNLTINAFYSKLENRALLSAIIFLEKDELNKKKYQEYESRYLNTLDKETVQIYDANGNVAFVSEIRSYPVDALLLNQIRRSGKLHFQAEGQQYAGIYYEDNQGDFVIVSSGVDMTGQDRLYRLRIILSSLFLIGILINYIFNVVLAKKTFKPFSSILRKVNTISTENLNSRLPQVNKPGDELSELTQTLNTLLERLEAGVNHQKQFLKNVSHELKTPLAAILGEAELSLDKERSPKEYQQVLQKIVKSTSELNSVIEGLLLISGLENNTSPATYRPFRLDELLWEVLEKLHYKYPDAEVETLIEVEDSDLLQLHSHPELVATAITNIIDNALKFSDDQKVILKITLTERQQVALLVQDQGPGIPVQEQDKVFELFYRGSNTQYLKPGHGVGLSLTKHIAEFCHIDLAVSSIPHKGTEVRLVFPVA